MTTLLSPSPPLLTLLVAVTTAVCNTPARQVAACRNFGKYSFVVLLGCQAIRQSWARDQAVLPGVSVIFFLGRDSDNKHCQVDITLV